MPKAPLEGAAEWKAQAKHRQEHQELAEYEARQEEKLDKVEALNRQSKVLREGAVKEARDHKSQLLVRTALAEGAADEDGVVVGLDGQLTHERARAPNARETLGK